MLNRNVTNYIKVFRQRLDSISEISNSANLTYNLKYIFLVSKITKRKVSYGQDAGFFALLLLHNHVILINAFDSVNFAALRAQFVIRALSLHVDKVLLNLKVFPLILVKYTK